MLADEYPELSGNIRLALPDEYFRRVGQSAVAASLPDKGQKKLADRESDRRKREQYYASLSGWNRREALAAADPLALEAGEVSNT